MLCDSNRILDDLRIASPCPMAWEKLQGDEKIRFCGKCQLNVYNIAGMTRSEAVQTIQEREGRLCVRLYRRADGTVITSNCPLIGKYLADLSIKFGFGVTVLVGLLVALLPGDVLAELMGAPRPTPSELPLADYSYDFAREMVRATSFLTLSSSLVFGCIRSARQYCGRRSFVSSVTVGATMGKNVLVSIALATVIHLLGTFAINNYYSPPLGGGL